LVGFPSSASTKKLGKTNPIAAPNGFAALAIVVAIARPDSPYQLPEIIAGALRING